MPQSYTILTVAIGADYRRDLQAGLNSKRTYATLHRYKYIEAGDEIYTQERPPAWYKIKAILNYLNSPEPKSDWLFVSDADVMIVNYNKPLSDIVDPFTEGDVIWTLDACGHLNAGNIFIRTSSPNVIPFFERVWSMTKYMYHPWWDNAAMVSLYLSDPSVKEFLKTEINAAKFNAYIQSLPTDELEQNITDLVRDDTSLLHWLAPREALYQPGDLLVHFAGVYDTKIIAKMMEYIAETGNVDKDLFISWLPRSA